MSCTFSIPVFNKCQFVVAVVVESALEFYSIVKLTLTGCVGEGLLMQLELIAK